MSTTAAGPRAAEFRMKVVGRRVTDRFDWDNVRQLVETAEVLRGTPKLVPRGLFRFATFEEAHEWMMKQIICTHARHGRKISFASAGR